MNRRTTIMSILAGAAVLLAGHSAVSLANANDSPEACCEECGTCRTTCLECVDACLKEGGREQCVRLCLDCADICVACDNLVARKSPLAPAIMAVCAEACQKCAAECAKHKGDTACKACADSCERCAKKCLEAAAAK